MTIDLNNLLANIALDTYDTAFPAGALLELRSGGVAGAENADTGTLLVSITLPATPWNAAALERCSRSVAGGLGSRRTGSRSWTKSTSRPTRGCP